MLKRALLASVVMFSFSAAQADEAATDLGATGISNWSGLYAGIQAGMVSNDSSVSGVADTEGFSGPNADFSQEALGAFIGFDQMIGDSLLVGVVADYNARFGSDDNGTVDNDYAAAGSGWRTQAEWDASIRARLGLTMDRALIYATGGVSFANFKLDNPGCGPCAYWDDRNILGGTRTGWVAGAGIEYKITSNWRGKLEYLHADYGSVKRSDVDYTSESDITTDSVMFGLSYQFN